MRVLRWSVLLCLTQCATAGDDWKREAETCEAFGPFDARVREALDGLLASAPGETLVRETARLNALRRSCARHTATQLLVVREHQGIEAVLRELEALSATYPPEVVRALLVEALGDEARALEPLLAEAQAHASEKARALDEAQPLRELGLATIEPALPEPAAPAFPSTLCDAPTPCAQLECIAERAEPAEAAAKACLTSLAGESAVRRARGVARVLSLVGPAPGGARMEALSTLETLRQRAWPQVLAARAAGQRGLAAQLAEVFQALPSARADVEQLRTDAERVHRARAQALQGFPQAAWLHAWLAEQFGGAAAPALPTGVPWAPVRWRCDAPKPELAALPFGVRGVVAARCERAKAPAAAESNDSLRTFELERELQGQRITGTVTLTCADHEEARTFQVESAEQVGAEVARVVDTVTQGCRALHARAALADCAMLRQREPGWVISRYVEHARFTGQWEPCFDEWLRATEGVGAGPVPPVAHNGVARD